MALFVVGIRPLMKWRASRNRDMVAMAMCSVYNMMCLAGGIVTYTYSVQFGGRGRDDRGELLISINIIIICTRENKEVPCNA